MTERIMGWVLLNRECHKCKKDRADYNFDIVTRGQPGHRSLNYHLECMPEGYKTYLEGSKRDMMKAASQPPGAS